MSRIPEIRDMTWVKSFVSIAICGLAQPALAQDLEPRAYAASPIGMTFVLAGIGRSSGGVLMDPAAPFEDVRATVGMATVGAGRTFSLFGRTALGVGALPYARAEASGRIEEETQTATRLGLADARLKVSVNLLGGTARRLRAFATAPRTTIVGVSLSAIAPTGQYDSARLVNLGSNRWAFKPEAGVSVPVGRWTIDGYGGVWMFTTNDRYYPGTSRREQDPIVALQAHVSYTIRPRLWLAFNATWYSGGTSTVDEQRKANLQRNSRAGATMSLPLGTQQSLKVSYSTGATTRFGSDFNTVAVAWQIAWTRP